MLAEGHAGTNTRRLLCLGDSYTVGEGVAEPEGWPARLAARLPRAPAVQIVARTGWTVAELHAGIDAAAPEGPFDLVTVLAGVNDQYRGLPPGDYPPAFGALLDRATGFAGGHPGRVVAISIPDWGVSPFAEGRDRERIAREIDGRNAAAASEARRRGIAWVDITGISRSPECRSAFAPDGLHPSGAQYEAWTGPILAAASAALALPRGLTPAPGRARSLPPPPSPR